MGVEAYNGNSRYLGKITSEHRIRPKYMAMVGAYLDKLQDIYDLYVAVLNAFDLDTAVGKQLDTIGQIVGADRVLDFNPSYAESKLDDGSYRKLIRAQISTNQWDGTMRGLIELWEGIFGEYRIKILDRQDMSILAEFHRVEDLFEAELISKGYFAPRAEGVMVNYLFVMESSISGEIFVAGAHMADELTDWLKDNTNIPERMDSAVYMAGAKVDEFVTDRLPSFAGELSGELNASLFYGGRVVEETITQYMNGG